MSASVWIFYAVTVITFAISVFYAYVKNKLSYWQKRGVTTPPPHFIFGNFKDTFTFRKSPGEVLQNIYESANPNDPYVGFYVFHKPMLMLRDPELIKRIMVKDFDIFPNRQFGGKLEKDSVGLVNLLGIRQPRWKFLRSKMTPSLTGQKLRHMVPLMETCGEPLLKYLEDVKENSDGWKEVELKSLCSKYSTDVISSVAFGITTNSFNEKDTAFWEAGQKVLSGVKRGIILLIMFFVPGMIRFIEPLMTKPANFFRTVFWDSMTTREKLNMKRGDLIDYFIALKNGEQNPHFEFDGDNLLAQAVAFYVAGFEATSTAIAFTLYELAQHPEYEKHLYEEIKEVGTKQELTVEVINSLTFLDQVVNETLRLHPPLPVIDRVAMTDYLVPEYNLIIEKETPIYVSINGTNRDPKYFENPTKFNPFREENKQNDVHNNSMAFGIGPRSCIGKRFGQLMTKVALIIILKKYQVYRTQDENTPLNPITVFTTAADGVCVNLKRRSDV